MGAIIHGPQCPVCGSTDTTLGIDVIGDYYTDEIGCRQCWLEQKLCKGCTKKVCEHCRVVHYGSKMLKSDCGDIRKRFLLLKGVSG